MYSIVAEGSSSPTLASSAPASEGSPPNAQLETTSQSIFLAGGQSLEDVMDRLSLTVGPSLDVEPNKSLALPGPELRPESPTSASRSSLGLPPAMPLLAVVADNIDPLSLPPLPPSPSSASSPLADKESCATCTACSCGKWPTPLGAADPSLAASRASRGRKRSAEAPALARVSTAGDGLLDLEDAHLPLLGRLARKATEAASGSLASDVVAA